MLALKGPGSKSPASTTKEDREEIARAQIKYLAQAEEAEKDKKGSSTPAGEGSKPITPGLRV